MARFKTDTGKAINKLDGPNCDLFRTFAYSPVDAQKITDMIKKAEFQIHDLLQKCQEEKTDVRVFMFHLFSAQEFN